MRLHFDSWLSILSLAVLACTEPLFGISLPLQNATPGVISRQKSLVFSSPWGDDLHLGDTLTLLPKRSLSDGTLTDYPANQRFDVSITVGKEYAFLVFPDGATSTDTTDVTLPIRLFAGTAEVRVGLEAFALDVDTSRDALLRAQGSRGMLEHLTAPSGSIKARLVGMAGYLKLRLLDYTGARQCFSFALELDSLHGKTPMYDMACAFAREGKTSDALLWLRRACDSGFDNYVHAINDSDLTSLHGMPEFREIVSSPFTRKRTRLLNALKERPGDAGNIFFSIADSYLEQADVDSFFVALEQAMQNGYYPTPNLTYLDKYSSVRSDPRYDSLINRYSGQYAGRVFSTFEAFPRPDIVRRIECPLDDRTFLKCRNLVELRITRSETGELPAEIAELPQLRIIRYVSGGFRAFPDAIARCTALDTLTAEKGLSRTLPGNFGDLVRLRQLQLRNGRIESLPSSFSRLSRLADLSLAGNALTTFPAVLASLASLEHLDLSGNSISVLPGAVEGMSGLKSLNLADNRLRSVPASIGRLAALKNLDLSLNRLSALPDEVANLGQIERLDLSFNELKSLPRALERMHSLRTLLVYGNQLDKPAIDSLRSRLPHCRITGDAQNAFHMQDGFQGKVFRDASLDVSFSYPSRFAVSVRKGGDDSTESVIELSHEVKNEWEIDSVTYYFTSSAGLTIRFSREPFDRIADDAGFEKNEAFDDTAGAEAGEEEDQELWASLGRQGMHGDVSVISLDGWRGFYGTNFTGRFGESADGVGSGYQGLEEFFVAMARKKLGHGVSVSLSFSSDIYEDNDAFQAVLSTIRLSEPDAR